MSSLIQVRAESTPKDILMSTQKLLNMATKRAEPKFENTENRVGTLFKENAYFYQLNDNLDAYKYTGEFTICFWAKFKDLGKTDEAYGNKITLVLNDGTTISADIPANVVMTDYHWVKIQRDSSNLITIYLDNSAIKTETSNAVFSLADNSYIFVGNTNRYFTGYEVIVDDILIFGGISSAVETTPNGYLNPARFTMLLYIKVSDGSVWGYADDGTPPMINAEAFADTTNVSMPVDANVLQFVTTGGSPASLKTLNQSNLGYDDDILVAGDAGPFANSISIRCIKVNGDNGDVNIRFLNNTLNTTGEFTLAFWILTQGEGYFQGNGIKIGVSSDRVTFYLAGLRIDPKITENSWHYLAICRDSQGVCYTYVDGNLTRTFDYANATFDISTYTSNSHTIGVGGVSWLYDVLMTNQCMFTGNFTPPIAGVINGG